jgi:hypothetical protein
LESIRSVEIRTRDGRILRGSDLTASIAVVYFSRDDRNSAEVISKRADVRIAWGGRDAVETIVSLPKRFDCEDVIYGPKLSFMAIGREQLSDHAALKRVARRAATDSSVFDQYACASPHTIFVERGGAFEPKAFAEKLAAEMGLALVRIPKLPIDGGTAAKVTSARLKYELGGRGTIWCSSGTEWSVLYDDESTSLADPVYSRVIHVCPVDDILHAARQANPDIQTIGLALDGERRHQFADLASQRGAVRFPEVGRMTEFDVAWDGLYLADRIVRWVVLGGPFS